MLKGWHTVTSEWWSNLAVIFRIFWNSSSQNHLIKSWWHWSWKSLQLFVICGQRSFLIFDCSMNFPDGEEYRFNERILASKTNPLFKKTCSQRLKILRYFECSEFPLFYYQKIFCSFWWLAELCSVWSLCHGFSKLCLSRSCIKMLRIYIKTMNGFQFSLTWTLILKSLSSSNFHYRRNNS